MNGKRVVLSLFCTILLVTFSLVPSHPAFPYEAEVKATSETLANFIVEGGKKTVAVVDFTDLQGNVMELGRFLAEEFSITLSSANKGKFDVIDRTHLRSLMKEYQFSLSGLIDPATAQKLGELIGVEALVTGTITPFGDSVKLQVKIIELSTAKVLGTVSLDIARTQAINELLSKEITQAPSGITTQETSITTPSALTKLKIISMDTDSSWKSFDNELNGWNTVNFDDSYWYNCEEMFDIDGLGKAKAIWYPGVPRPKKVYFRKTLEINGSKILSGNLFFKVCSSNSAALNFIYLFVNDTNVGKLQGNWSSYEPVGFNIASLLRIGKNIIAIKADFENRPNSDYYWGATGNIKYQ